MSEPFLGQIMSVGFLFAPRGWAQCAGQVLPLNQNTALFSLLGTTYGGDGRTTMGLPDLRGRVIVGSGPSSTGSLNLPPGAIGGTASVTLNESQLPAHIHPATGTVSLGGLQATGNVSLGVTAQISNQTVTVKGSMSATTDGAGSDLPTAGGTIGDPSGSTKIYASYNPNTAVPLAEITSTGQFSAAATGTASGDVSLAVAATGTSGPTTTITVGPNTNAAASFSILPPYLALFNVIALQGMFPSRS
jgi:microcystin-dependent protein